MLSAALAMSAVQHVSLGKRGANVSFADFDRVVRGILIEEISKDLRG